jgi:SAM-dependent methyltransferase
MMFLLRLLTRNKGGPAMDPLHVSMTGVRMGERFLQIGCNDKALLTGLAAKAGLSGACAVAASGPDQIKLAQTIGRKVGALIDVQDIQQGGAWPFEDGSYDLVVVDDTDEGFKRFEPPADILRKALGALRKGGRIEVVTRLKKQAPQFDFVRLLTEAGFKPVRQLAERDGFLFVEGLRTN